MALRIEDISFIGFTLWEIVGCLLGALFLRPKTSPGFHRPTVWLGIVFGAFFTLLQFINALGGLRASASVLPGLPALLGSLPPSWGPPLVNHTPPQAIDILAMAVALMALDLFGPKREGFGHGSPLWVLGTALVTFPLALLLWSSLYIAVESQSAFVRSWMFFGGVILVFVPVFKTQWNQSTVRDSPFRVKILASAIVGAGIGSLLWLAGPRTYGGAGLVQYRTFTTASTFYMTVVQFKLTQALVWGSPASTTSSSVPSVPAGSTGKDKDE